MGPLVPGVSTGAVRTAINSMIGERQVLLAAGVLAVVVLFAVILFSVRHRKQSPGETLRQILADVEAVTVLMHPDPDPDAMGSAVGIAYLADTVDTDVDICYSGEIRRHENRAFRTVLDLEFERVETAADLPDAPVVLVDHNEARGFEGAGTLDPLAVIDHHEGHGAGREFTDVRPAYGACSSIVAEYLRDVGATQESDGNLTLDAAVASGLLYGIQTDTSYLSRGCSEAEFDCCSYLYPAIDGDVLDRIANPPVDTETLDVKARAIHNRIVRMPFVVSDVGEVSNVDAIAQAAEELLQLEGISAVVVFGKKDGVYHLSGRSRDDRVHMGHALELAVSKMVGGAAGGHARMGGGQVPVDQTTTQVDRTMLANRLFTALNGEEA